MGTSSQLDLFYSQILGERWSQLKDSLQAKSHASLARINQFSNEPRIAEIRLDQEIPRDSQGLLTHYWMDPASVLPAQHLGIGPGDQVLDLCAAPGGKALILAEGLVRHAGDCFGFLTVNEISESRRERLKKVLRQYLPEDFRQHHLRVTGQDGAILCLKHPEKFDKILLDVPCSGESHLLSNLSELEKWSPGKNSRIEGMQYRLLCAAGIALRPGGVMVYSTCSVSSRENDGVIEKFLKKKKNFSVENWDCNWPNIEKTKWGWQVFPDRSSGGPIFWSRIRKMVGSTES